MGFPDLKPGSAMLDMKLYKYIYLNLKFPDF